MEIKAKRSQFQSIRLDLVLALLGKCLGQVNCDQRLPGVSPIAIDKDEAVGVAVQHSPDTKSQNRRRQSIEG